ncbi:hypothetical protein SBBP1_110063 [Burkholderiales bacterium]|nr:hypothetical protein SBBP1_110063 [Burkholderiales bacterium]
MNMPPKKPAAPVAAAGADDASIPVLTERLGLPPLEFDTTLPLIETTGQNPHPAFEGLTALPHPPRAAAPVAAPALPREATGARASAPQSEPEASGEAVVPREAVSVLGATGGSSLPAGRSAADGRHWARIEIELRTSILREIADQLPREVESIVRTRMNATIDRVLSSLAAETRLAIAASLRDIVEHAVHAELERLRNSNRG